MHDQQLSIRIVFAAVALGGLVLIAALVFGAFTEDTTADVAYAEHDTEQIPLDLGSYTDWSVRMNIGGDEMVCWIVSEPKKQGGDDQRFRRQAAAIVYRYVDPHPEKPDQAVFEEILVQLGNRREEEGIIEIEYKEKSTVQITIDDEQLVLATGGVAAGTRFEEELPEGEKIAQSILQAMQGSNDMKVEGISETGDRLLDTYSLLGFSSAYRAMIEECQY